MPGDLIREVLQDEVAPKAAGELALSVQVDLASSSRIYLMFDEAPSECRGHSHFYSSGDSRTVDCNIVIYSF